jgi:hypothetical protein
MTNILTKKLLLFLFILLSSISQVRAVELHLLDKLEDVSEYVKDNNKMLEAKHKVLNMLIKCEFDEACELALIPPLEELIKHDNNVIYKGFLTYLKWEKKDLEYNMAHCNLPDKKAIRVVFAKCYQIKVDEEIKSPPIHREEIDKLEYEREMCIKNGMESLANNGNIFAQAQLVNSFEYLKDPKAMSFWLNKVESQKGTQEYNNYFRCLELP